MEETATIPDSVSSDSPTLSEMIDLALGTPEVGAVNFNILRLVLHDLVLQLGMDNLVVNLDEFNLNQVEKYKNYIDGNAQSTPMPMVLRVNQQSSANLPGGSGRHDSRIRTTPRSGRDDSSRSRSHHHGGPGVPSGGQLDPNQPGTSGRGQGSIIAHISKGDTNIPHEGTDASASGTVSEDRSGRGRDRGRDRDRDRDRSKRNLNKGGGGGLTQTIVGGLTTEERVDRLEKNLEVLYQMPGNPLMSVTGTGIDGQQGAAGQSGIEGAAGAAATGANVNDMWQIIQLNNRVASCESAIQKMATLIEDLALDQNQLRGDTHDVRNHAESLLQSHSKMSMEFSPLSERCTLVQEALDELRDDLAIIKDEWKTELNQIFDGNFDKLPSSLQQKLRLRPGEGKESDAAADFDYDKSHGKFPQAFKKLTPNTIPHFPVAELNTMDIAEINTIPKSILHYMTPDQKDAIDRRQAENRPKPNLNVMRPDEIKLLNIGDLEKLSPADISNIKPSKMVFLKPDVRKRFDEIRHPAAHDRHSTKHLNLYSIPPHSIPGIPLSQLEQLTPSEAANLDDEILHNMTHEQRKLVKEIAKHTPPKSFPGLNPEVLDPTVISRLPPAELQRMSEAQLKRLTIDQINAMTIEQRDVVDRMKTENEKHSRERKGGHKGRSDSPQSPDEANTERRGRSKNREKRGQRDGKECSSRERDRSFSQDPQSHSRERYTPVDIVKGKIARPENLTPISKEETIDLVQDELQKQYVRLQEQQRKLADDIQKKMELVYEKLFKEIVTNDHNLPYMAVGEPPEAILGPGVCTLAGMPPGVAVCQFPEADGKHGLAKSPLHDVKVCPGVGLCPASDNCPNCNAYAQTTGRSGPGHVLPPPRKATREPDDPEFPSDPLPDESVLDARYREGTADHEGRHSGTADGNRRAQSIAESRKSNRPSHMQRSSQVPKHLQDLLLQEMRSLVLIDLEKIREEMKIKEVSVFDESDILERLDTIWEAIKLIKSNEETLAVKILKQDAILSKLPKDTIDRIHRIPAENLEAIASATWDKPMMLPQGSFAGTTGGTGRQSIIAKDNKLIKLPPKYQVGASSTAIGTKGTGSSPSNFSVGMLKTNDGPGGVGAQEVATLYNNLSNLIAETTEHKMKIEELGDQVKIMEAGMVTKIMLQDVMSDKADKGDVNTKVSYDEFGRAIDDLSTNLKDLVNESFNNSEHWKQVTDNLAQDVNDKMDKAELAPLKTYFKSNIKALDERVRQLQMTMEEPDPAGTRKKLLRDYNCISCDRKCNISGITNAPTLPLLGPIAAGHTSASRRAFDLHRMRIKKKIEQTCRDLPMMERQLKCLGLLNADGSLRNDSELHKVNRYQGGSHTAVTASARIRASQRLSSLAKAVASPTPNNEEEDEEEVEEIFLAASLHDVEMYGEGEYEEEMEEMLPQEANIIEVVAAQADEPGLLEEMEGEGYEEQMPRKSGLKVLPEPEMASAEEMEQAYAYTEE